MKRLLRSPRNRILLLPTLRCSAMPKVPDHTSSTFTERLVYNPKTSVYLVGQECQRNPPFKNHCNADNTALHKSLRWG